MSDDKERGDCEGNGVEAKGTKTEEDRHEKPGDGADQVKDRSEKDPHSSKEAAEKDSNGSEAVKAEGTAAVKVKAGKGDDKENGSEEEESQEPSKDKGKVPSENDDKKKCNEKAPEDEDSEVNDKKTSEGKDVEENLEEGKDLEEKLEGGDETKGDTEKEEFKSVANKVESESSDEASPIPSPPPMQQLTPTTPATDDPNFAVVCAFLEKFGAKCNLECPSIARMQELLETSQREVKQELISFQCKLLRDEVAHAIRVWTVLGGARFIC